MLRLFIRRMSSAKPPQILHSETPGPIESSIISKITNEFKPLYFKIDNPIIKSKKALSEEEIQVEVLKKLKMDGLLLKNVELVKAMDKDMETYSLIIPAAFKKDGDFTSSSSVVTKEQFELLRNYVNDKMIEICEEMLSGQVKIEPCKSSKVTYCDYCNYSAICQFDTSIRDNKYKVILKKKKDDLWNAISNKVNEEEGK